VSDGGIAQNWASRLRQLRQQRLLSQRDLAELAGLTQTTIANIELGKRRPHPRTLRKISEALGIPPSELAAAPPDAD